MGGIGARAPHEGAMISARTVAALSVAETRGTHDIERGIRIGEPRCSEFGFLILEKRAFRQSAKGSLIRKCAITFSIRLEKLKLSR